MSATATRSPRTCSAGAARCQRTERSRSGATVEGVNAADALDARYLQRGGAAFRADELIATWSSAAPFSSRLLTSSALRRTACTASCSARSVPTVTANASSARKITAVVSFQARRRASTKSRQAGHHAARRRVPHPRTAGTPKAAEGPRRDWRIGPPGDPERQSFGGCPGGDEAAALTPVGCRRPTRSVHRQVVRGVAQAAGRVVQAKSPPLTGRLSAATGCAERAVR